MQDLAEQIFEIIKDYQCDYPDRKFEITVEHIIAWANQFGNDAQFVLEEMLHILPEIYISKEKAKNLLRERLLDIQKFYGYKTMNEMVINTYFFDVQKGYKSQPEILAIVDEILQEEYLINYKDYLDNPKTNYIYFDDVLATGGTTVRDLSNWLKENDTINNKQNFKLILNGAKSLGVCFFAYHQLGFGNMQYILMKTFDDKIKNKLLVGTDYVIENQVKWFQQKLNCLYPTNNQSNSTIEYLAKLKDVHERVPAYRPLNMPKKETFFSSPANREKLEKIFLEKGIELLSKVQSENPDKRKRPLGDTVRSHKTFGTGTLFFTWRNISNTCPLVFWWDVTGHNWLPLFCVKNRGI